MNNSPSDLGIPLLTEVIGAQVTPVAQPVREPLPFTSAPPAAATVTPAVKPQPEAPEAPAVPPPTLAPAAAPAQAGSPWSDASLGELESELRERITRQVLGRIDFVLDHRVRSSVTDIVDHAIDALAAEIKRGLHETLNDIVARAVAQEISRLQSTKK